MGKNISNEFGTGRIHEMHTFPRVRVNALRRGRSRSQTSSVGNRSKISIVVAENHPLLMRGIASLVAREDDIELAAQARDGDEAMEAIKKLEPDLAVLSLKMPGKGALDVIETLANDKLKTRYVLLASQMNEADFLRALHLDVRGVVLKDMPEGAFLNCVRTVWAGGEFLDKELLLRMFGKLLPHSGMQGDGAKQLTVREHAVMDHVMRGLSNKEVARQLGLTEGTVKSHLHRVYEKLHVRGRYRLIQLSKSA
jgi:two-component system nitrate/nitrite response regulator NarL